MQMVFKQEMDIEALLHWAYAKQCVDKVAATQFTPRGPSGDANGAALAFMQLGCRVDSSGAAARVMGARAADDAMMLHDAVLGLEEIWLDDEAGVWTRERAEGAGFEIARHQRAWWMVGQGLKVPLHPAGVMALVIIHAKNGTRPEFHPDWRPRRGRRADRYGYACQPLSANMVAMHRAEYTVWRAALVYLAEVLKDGLAKHAPLPPQAPEAPWLRDLPGKSWPNPENSNDDKPLKKRKKKCA